MTKKIMAKEKHRTTLIEYLSNPDNPIIPRVELSVQVLGFSRGSVIYVHFTPDELSSIEAEALELRRKCYASKLAQVDSAVLDRAIKDGDPSAAKLAYQRFEGWSEKQIRELVFDGPMLAQMFAVLPPEIAEQVKAALIAKHKELT
jgi:hypothetical protein